MSQIAQKVTWCVVWLLMLICLTPLSLWIYVWLIDKAKSWGWP